MSIKNPSQVICEATQGCTRASSLYTSSNVLWAYDNSVVHFLTHTDTVTVFTHCLYETNHTSLQNTPFK